MKRIFLPILFCGCSVAIFFICNLLLAHHQNDFYTQALRSAQITLPADATLKDKVLAYARALAQNDPLVALPGTDIRAFGTNASLFPQLMQTLYAEDKTQPHADLLYSLYPADFLTQLAKTEAARRQFVQSGTAADEAAYYQAAENMFAAYYQDVARFRAAFLQVIPASSGKFATDGDIVSRSQILVGLETLSKKMRVTQEAFTLREVCARGDTTACPPITKPTAAVTSEIAIAPQELAQAKEVRAMLASAHEEPHIASEPMYLLPSTACAKNMQGAPLFSFYTPQGESHYSGAFPIYIGNIRFQSLATTTANASFVAFSNALSKHITYLYDSPMLHYSCPELAQDSGKLFLMREVYAFAQSQKLSTYATTTADREALAALEQPDMQVVAEHTVTEYLATAATLSLPDALQNTIQNFVLAYTNNSEHFEANLGELLNDELSNSALLTRDWPVDLDVPYLFFVRSSFSMLLLADNQSAMGEIPKLFPPNTIPKEQTPFLYFSELSHTQSTLAQIVHDIHYFYEAHVDSTTVAP